MSVVCVDTQIIYWAITGKASRGAEELTKPARDFMKWLDAQRHHIIIPSIVVGEMLVPIPDDEVGEVLARFNQDWMIVDYDLRAARVFSRMRRDFIANKRFDDIRQLSPDTTRKELNADSMIIATAISNGADIIYSHNKDLRSVAEGWIKARDFLEEDFQLSLIDVDTPDPE